MNSIEMHNLAVKTADSIFNDLDKSLRRAGALFGNPEEALHNLIFPEIKNVLGISIGGNVSGGYGKDEYTGEVRDIGLLLNCKDQPWGKSVADISAIAEQGNAKNTFKPGDYLIIPVSMDEYIVDGVEFSAIEEGGVRLVVTAVFDDMVIFNFEDELLKAAMNSEATNKGGFAGTAVAKYLNEYFLDVVFDEVKDYLLPNKDGLKISLPTAYEVFGGGERWDKSVNWGEVIRHPYFEKCTNRIKVCIDDLNDTNWWWLSSPAAAHTSNFCLVTSNGSAYATSTASSTSGAIAPALCVGKRHR